MPAFAPSIPLHGRNQALLGELILRSPIRPFASSPVCGDAIPSTLDTRPSTLAEGANDYIGNVVGLLDPDNGDLVAEYVPSEATTCRRSPTAYDPFGRQIRATGTYADKNPIRFSSQYTDNETGLVYFGFRYYHPQWGRFINRDLLEEEGGENLYRFVSNDPVNRWDLLGLQEMTDEDSGEINFSGEYELSATVDGDDGSVSTDGSLSYNAQVDLSEPAATANLGIEVNASSGGASGAVDLAATLTASYEQQIEDIMATATFDINQEGDYSLDVGFSDSDGDWSLGVSDALGGSGPSIEATIELPDEIRVPLTPVKFKIPDDSNLFINLRPDGTKKAGIQGKF